MAIRSQSWTGGPCTTPRCHPTASHDAHREQRSRAGGAGEDACCGQRTDPGCARPSWGTPRLWPHVPPGCAGFCPSRFSQAQPRSLTCLKPLIRSPSPNQPVCADAQRSQPGALGLPLLRHPLVLSVLLRFPEGAEGPGSGFASASASGSVQWVLGSTGLSRFRQSGDGGSLQRFHVSNPESRLLLPACQETVSR